MRIQRQTLSDLEQVHQKKQNVSTTKHNAKLIFIYKNQSLKELFNKCKFFLPFVIPMNEHAQKSANQWRFVVSEVLNKKDWPSALR